MSMIEYWLYPVLAALAIFGIALRYYRRGYQHGQRDMRDEMLHRFMHGTVMVSVEREREKERKEDEWPSELGEK